MCLSWHKLLTNFQMNMKLAAGDQVEGTATDFYNRFSGCYAESTQSIYSKQSWRTDDDIPICLFHLSRETKKGRKPETSDWDNRINEDKTELKQYRLEHDKETPYEVGWRCGVIVTKERKNAEFLGIFEISGESNPQCIVYKKILNECEIGIYAATKNETATENLCITFDKINIDEINSEIDGKITIKGASFQEKRLQHCKEGKWKYCSNLSQLMAGIATAFADIYEIDNKFRDIFDKGVAQVINNTDIFQIHGNNFRIATGKGLHQFLTDTNKIFEEYSADRQQFKLIFQYNKKNKQSNQEYIEQLFGKENISPYNGTLKNNSQNPASDKSSNTSLARNRIIFGAPGTGKSHKANRDANALLLGARDEKSPLTDDDKNTKAGHMERVTFHPEYSYYDFVGSYKPVMKNVQVEGKDATERKIEYDFVPGPFTRILVKALKDKEHPYLLLIEEINRARVAAVFGDIFQLLDRTEEGESEYSICLSEDLKEHLGKQGLQLNELKLPPNLYIWATMNSADQGVYPLDTAFKRRWSMEYLDIDSGKEEDDWNQIRTGINKLLIEKGHVNEDKLMGYYFLKAEERDTEDHLKEALAGKVLMYLFDDAAKPCRKDIFKEINKARIYSDLRVKLSLSEPNLGIFDGAVFWPGKNTTTGSDQDSAAPKAEEAEPVDNQQ